MPVKRNKNITRKWFGSWSNEYDRTLGKLDFHRDLLDLVVKNSGVKNNDKVLDIGCGTGLLSLKLLQRADCVITAVDNSKEMMALFENKIKKLKLGSRVVCKMMDAGSIKFADNTFDIAASSVVLHHLKEKLNPLKKIFRVLKPGGRFIIGEVDMDTTGQHTDINRFSRIIKVQQQEWITALKAGDMDAFVRMYDNSKRHVFNQGEYCISLRQWGEVCRKAGFGKIAVKKVPRHKCFGIVIAEK
ncbi:MAG: class I SAM-dependent methyltransferase [Phycisphaerae bacterium]|nr:class I SAM-dependent methyltransferase [Phycisphaerae bacterium]MDD5381015.1 class I SAM-dependent methyltransferase [Phycisphaerae bacterium]